uniref:Uncharacterized protein n=1 Tax=Oryza sativa subsp. japonica TaxID=39947 RepID=Q5Z4E9_ORYSJ|nr:hypothetical protein [Oryza sativa Japonica Group]
MCVHPDGVPPRCSFGGIYPLLRWCVSKYRCGLHIINVLKDGGPSDLIEGNIIMAIAVRHP